MKGRTPDPTYPRTREAVSLLVTLVLLQLLFFALVAGIGAAFDLELTEGALTLGVVNLAVFAVVIFRGWRRTGVPWSSVFPTGEFPVALLLPIGLAVLGGSVVLSEIDNLVRMVVPVSASMEEFFENLGTEESGVLASTFLFVIVAPLTEEYLFRGLILRGFLQHHSAKWAIAISALLFGLFHLNPWQFFPATIAGLLLGWLTLETGTLWPAILTHAANNGLSSWAQSIMPDIPGYSALNDEVALQPFWFDSAGLAVLAAGLWLLWRTLGSRQTREGVGAIPTGPPVEPEPDRPSPE
jgi:membrane protease YdiL (CAAX protease family)